MGLTIGYGAQQERIPPSENTMLLDEPRADLAARLREFLQAFVSRFVGHHGRRDGWHRLLQPDSGHPASQTKNVTTLSLVTVYNGRSFHLFAQVLD